jgi:LacI family fructose operon transcriptional repressor
MSKSVEEIARETGFSITTVRLVIYGQAEKYRISAKTTRRIEDYIALHGYSINHAARSLKLKRSETIGFVVPDLANPFFARLIAALEILCRKHNLLLLTVASHEDPELEDRAVDNLLARGVDGLVIAPCQAVTPRRQAKADKAEVPIVMLDRDYSPTAYPTVLSDNYQAGLKLTGKMLREAGGPCHFLCGHAESPSIQDRILGFEAAYGKKRLAESDALIRRDAEDSALAGRKMMYALIDALQQPPPAFMCSSLLVLEGALQQIKSQIGRIDKDILIGTFDDHTMLDLLPNRVLSIRQNEAALAKRVFERLIAPKKDGKSAVARDIVPSELIKRNL